MTDFSTFTVELKMPEENQTEQNLKQICATLFNENQLCDVTISCKDGQVQAHRMILSSVSSYLYKLFTSTPWPNPCSHPVILLRNSRVEDVRTAMEFIYMGSAKNIRKDKLQALMEVGRELECSSLIRSIETAVQTCGVAMFRRLVSNNVMAIAPITRNNDKSADSPATGPATATPLFKQEVADSQVHAQSKEGVYTLSIPKLPNSGLRKPEKKSPPNPSTSSSASPRMRNGNLLRTVAVVQNLRNEETSASASQFQGETFVYTNKDLGLDFSDMDTPTPRFRTPQTKLVREPGRLKMNGSPSSVRHLKRKSMNYASEQYNHRKISALKVEAKSDDDPATCPWCLQVFTNIPLLQRHIKTHVGVDKPKFVCEYCNTKFGRSAHLKRHLRTHTGEKPYQCSICLTRFARQDKLKIHLERHLQNGTSVGLNGTSASQGQNGEGQGQEQGHNQLPLPIKVLIPTQAQNTGPGPHCNGNRNGVSPSSAAIGNGTSLISPPPSKFNASMMYETVAKNLSPSTTITTVSSASARLG